MSVAGIRSNRGDGYQTLVAFDWALTVLTDPDYLWLEVDSISYRVDDVVIGKIDGTHIACQCKKNQSDYNAWTIGDLADELGKASSFLVTNRNSEVRFYSRSNFGVLGKLREHSSTQPDQISYQASLSKEHQATDSALSAKIAGLSSSLPTFDFLCRTKFEISPELDRMGDLLRERLRNIVSNPEIVFSVLWARLDQLGARMEGNGATSIALHRLTKDDLKTTIEQAGAVLAPPMNQTEIRQSFTNTSSIGRSWQREIGGRRIPSLIINELLEAITAKKRSILLTGLPGSGKTCAMLGLQEALEDRAKSSSDIVPLFIQSREFADLTTYADRQAQGLSEQWVEKAARMAETAHVVVVIDSLDVLSIAREHTVLKYFLAQIDRLLLISNVTVVTACRDFDRQYDRRIRERKWECELKCHPLNWDSEVVPLLEQFEISFSSIDKTTRELIANPRELALFVELAQQEGSFNVVTSQALAQRYLDTVVRANRALGDVAIQAIEAIASEMLKLRSLVVPHQRVPAPQDIQRELCSLNVLQDVQNGKLTFGHQTLLDVLVISGALRNGTTLNKFISGLSPVPFVRPSIRSFVAQLALGERREFRKQLRAVLLGSAAFHIQRLVAESFAEQSPVDEDWSLIRDLHQKQRDVFQVIYTSASSVEWHHFWLKNLVPVLKQTRDVEGLMGHFHHVARWLNADCVSVLSFWMDILSLDYLETHRNAERLGIYLTDIQSDYLTLAAPLVEKLLELKMTDHDFLGRVIARCVTAGAVDDTLLWRYIECDVSDKDMHDYYFHPALHCQPHEFGEGENNFLHLRMTQSDALLNLALDSIERWSSIRESQYSASSRSYRHGFLSESSFEAAHSPRQIDHIENLTVLLNAVECAVLHHAEVNSEWWLHNRERLCFNPDGALRFFGILACTAVPELNIGLIGRVLCDRAMLESELTYEMGAMLRSAFRLLDPRTQDAIATNILHLWDHKITDASSAALVMKARAKLLISIPRHLRSPDVQAVLNAYEEKEGLLIRQPDVRSHGGVINAPFSFEVFLSASDVGVLRLLSHYHGYSDLDAMEDNFLTGGEREVGSQLEQAASLAPARFLTLLSAYWGEIPDDFRDDIMNGTSRYLNYRHANANIEAWHPVEQTEPTALANQIFHELGQHPAHWRHRRAAARALEACAHAINDAEQVEQLTSLAAGFESMREDDPMIGDKVNLLASGINMARGKVTEALMIVANNQLQHTNTLPELLATTLRRFAELSSPAICAVILRRLSYLQSKQFDLGWELFDITMREADGLWQLAERCLYYAYHDHFDIISPLLKRLRKDGRGKDLETWGRISALAAMAKHIDFQQLLDDLQSVGSAEAWQGAATVWTNIRNVQLQRDLCFIGISHGLAAGGACAEAVAAQMNSIFREKESAVLLPVEIIHSCFSVFELDNKRWNQRFSEYHKWLNAVSQLDPALALSATEIYLIHTCRCRPSYLYDYENNLTQLMTRLFTEAEELEECDDGKMLNRVVAVQDTLLALGLNGMADWLKAAERSD